MYIYSIGRGGVRRKLHVPQGGVHVSDRYPGDRKRLGQHMLEERHIRLAHLAGMDAVPAHGAHEEGAAGSHWSRGRLEAQLRVLARLEREKATIGSGEGLAHVPPTRPGLSWTTAVAGRRCGRAVLTPRVRFRASPNSTLR